MARPAGAEAALIAIARRLSITALLAAMATLPLAQDRAIASPEGDSSASASSAAEPAGVEPTVEPGADKPALHPAASAAEPALISLDQARRLPAALRLADRQRVMAAQETQSRAPSAEALGPERSLSERLDLRLRPAPLAPPAQPGQRRGSGDVVFSLPLGEWWSLRTGVRVDYDDRPLDGTLDVDGAPTLGVGVRF